MSPRKADDVRILTLGGSNTGVAHGWVSALRSLMPDHTIENRFLGAVGSLYGLLRLLKARSENEPRPDVLVFEYALNDTLLLVNGTVSVATVRETLHDVVSYCIEERIGLVFLCLQLNPTSPKEIRESARSDDIYAAVARERGVAHCLRHSDVFGEVAAAQFVDPVHLSPEGAACIAEAVRARLGQPVPPPRSASRPTLFAYLDAAQARLQGPAHLVSLRSSVFEGPFVRLDRGGACSWDVFGGLVATMIRSTQRSGFYRIRAGGRAVRKNAQSSMRDMVPNLMTLHSMSRVLRAPGSLTIDLPLSEAELSGLRLDRTFWDSDPPEPFAVQQLEINGVMVRRERSRLRRTLEACMNFFRRGA